MTDLESLGSNYLRIGFPRPLIVAKIDHKVLVGLGG